MTERRPDFVVIGATKCGTTSLHDGLSAHPVVWLAPKDLRFFTAEHNWRRGPDCRGWSRA